MIPTKGLEAIDKRSNTLGIYPSITAANSRMWTNINNAARAILTDANNDVILKVKKPGGRDGFNNALTGILSDYFPTHVDRNIKRAIKSLNFT